jgi:GGDEF domain-containing protein
MHGTYETWFVNGSIALAILASYALLSIAARKGLARAQSMTAITGEAVLLGIAIWLAGLAIARMFGWPMASGANHIVAFALGLLEGALAVVALQMRQRRRSLGHRIRTTHPHDYAQRVDALTGLPNRVALEAETKRAIAEAQCRARQVALLDLTRTALRLGDRALGFGFEPSTIRSVTT